MNPYTLRKLEEYKDFINNESGSIKFGFTGVEDLKEFEKSRKEFKKLFRIFCLILNTNELYNLKEGKNDELWHRGKILKEKFLVVYRRKVYVYSGKETKKIKLKDLLKFLSTGWNNGQGPDDEPSWICYTKSSCMNMLYLEL